MDKEKQIEVITYEQDRLYFFVDQVSLAQKKYDRLFKTFKDAPYLSEGAQFLSDAGRELQFYKDVVEMFDKGYRKQSENVIEFPCKIGDTVYIIDEADDECGEDYVLAVKVLQFFINEHGIAVDLALPLGMRLNTWMVVGKNVFLTREEAEAHMRKEDEGK